MSRIILTRYESGEEHVVVGWDRPMQTFYWQEFNSEPEDWNAPEADEWEEMLGFAGYSPGELPDTDALIGHAHVNNQVVFDAILMAIDKAELIVVLKRHQTLDHPESNVILDFSNFFPTA